MEISPRNPGVFQGPFDQRTGTGLSQGREKAGNLLPSPPPSGTPFLTLDFLELAMIETTCRTVLPYEGTKFLCRKEWGKNEREREIGPRHMVY